MGSIPTFVPGTTETLDKRREEEKTGKNSDVTPQGDSTVLKMAPQESTQIQKLLKQLTISTKRNYIQQFFVAVNFYSLHISDWKKKIIAIKLSICGSSNIYLERESD